MIRRSGKRHLLFIAIEHLKPTLGCYGGSTEITPVVDAIAKRDTVPLNAHCQRPVSSPMRTTLMTLLWPKETEVMDLKTNLRAKDSDVVTLPHYFMNNGYIAASIVKIYNTRYVDSKKLCDTHSWSLTFVTPHDPTSHLDDNKRFASAPEVADDESCAGVREKLGAQ